MIELRELSHGYLRKNLFQDVSLRLLPNERYGIVGANGSGKSTLLRIMAHELEPDSGEVEIPNDVNVFRIGQDHNLSDEIAIIDTAMMGQREVYDAIKRKEALLEQPSDHPDIGNEIARLEEIIHAKEGYRLRSHAQSILEGLGVETHDHDQSLKILSGGYKWRVFLAQALVKSPDVLMLDEPTNHLDIVSIRWLELFLMNYRGLVVIVSHDKRFMDHVCTHILDIDFDTITDYAGNFESFEKARSLFLLQKEKEILAQEKEIAKKQAFIDRFRAKATKARQAQSRIKQLEKMEIVEPVKSTRIHPKFRFDISDIGSKEVLTVKGLSKSYGDKQIISDLSFAIQRGEKIAVIGPNGSGKSTLVKALTLEFSECAKFIKWGHGTERGYFAQDTGKKIKTKDISVLEWLWQFCADKPQSFVQGMLGRVLFSGEDAKKSTRDLSGGELGRLYLAYLMILKPNVLMLDEPTNHLDLESIESLTQALSDYEGTLIFVSHDRTFIDRLASRIVEISPKGINDFLGSYSEFVEASSRDYLDAVQESQASKGKPNKNVAAKLSYEDQKKRKAHALKLKKNLERIMLSVEDTENKIHAIDQQFLDEAFFKENDYEHAAKLGREKDALKGSLDLLIKDWEDHEKMLSEISAEDDE